MKIKTAKGKQHEKRKNQNRRRTNIAGYAPAADSVCGGGIAAAGTAHLGRSSQDRKIVAAASALFAGRVGANPDTGLVEVVEIPDHPWFVGTQYHPEYKSTVQRPHPLFVAFVGILRKGLRAFC